MSKDPKVIAETAVFRLLSDGTTQRFSAFRTGTRPEEWEECDSEETVATDLLADAVRRTREEISQGYGVHEMQLDLLAERVKAVEDRMDLQWAASNNALAHRLSALESRQHDEAREEADSATRIIGDPPPPRWHIERVPGKFTAFVSPEVYGKVREECRRELALEIAERLRRGEATSGTVRAALRSQEICADWIERKFLDEGEASSRSTTAAIGSE